MEPYGPVTGEARLVYRDRWGEEDWSRWHWARPKRVHPDAEAARGSVDGPARRVALWFLERGGLDRRADAALRFQYGVIPADAPKP